MRNSWPLEDAGSIRVKGETAPQQERTLLEEREGGQTEESACAGEGKAGRRRWGKVLWPEEGGWVLFPV